MARKHEAIEVGSGDVFVDLGFDKRLSWEDTFKAMAREREDWSDFEATVADGLDPAEHW
jgi:hypothetical protein